LVGNKKQKMSLEQRLVNQFRKDAKVADMGGYGLSGGCQDANSALDNYKSELMNNVESGDAGGRRKRGRPRKAKGGIVSGGVPSGGFFPGAQFLIPAAISLISHLAGKGHDGHAKLPGISGGMVNPFAGMERKMMGREHKGQSPPFVTMGSGMSGGVGSGGKMPKGYPSMYPGSFPMPGFYPGGQDGYQGIGGARQGRCRPKNPARVAAGRKAASENPWLKKVAAYRKSHPGMSQKDAMKALATF
jgi:hypothetical protein